MRVKSIDIICVGEVLVDMIGDNVAENLAQTKSFSKFVGGSPTNVVNNMTQLGFKTVLVATLGNDGLGNFIKDTLKNTNLNLQYLITKSELATSMILVSHTSGTPEFLPYRQADYFIDIQQIPEKLLKDSRVFHTTCFALSKNPAQATILQKAKEAFNNGCQLSIDLNYAQKIWGDTEVLPVLKIYCQYQPFVKLSDDDAFRIFRKHLSNNEIFDYFIGLGAKLVCLTKGKRGAFVSQKGQKTIFQSAPNVDNIVDATGAGDAFWSGFLAGYLEDFPIEACLKMANKLAAKKIQYVGGLPLGINLKQIVD